MVPFTSSPQHKKRLTLPRQHLPVNKSQLNTTTLSRNAATEIIGKANHQANKFCLLATKTGQFNLILTSLL
jgi:hypothetical protein